MKCRHCAAPWELEWQYCPECRRNRCGAKWPAVLHCRHCNAPWESDGWEYCPECKRNYGGAKSPATQTEAELRDVDDLIVQIRRAFDAVARGGGQTIHQAHLEGCYDEEKVWIAAGAKDPESHWSEVPDWKLESGASTLSFFDPEGWRFYIPAFMCWSLRNWRTTDSVTSDGIIWNLALTEDHNVKRYVLLNQDQCEAVHDFLAFFDRYSGLDDARNAIQAFWHQFKKE